MLKKIIKKLGIQNKKTQKTFPKNTDQRTFREGQTEEKSVMPAPSEEQKEEKSITPPGSDVIFSSERPLNPYTALKEKKLIDEMDGSTPLHHCKTWDDITQLLEKFGEEYMTLMARTANRRGELPIDSFFEFDEALSQKILPWTLLSPLSSVTTPLDPSYFVDKFCSDDNSSDIKSNIVLACEIVNKARDLVKFSLSHSAYNLYSNEMKDEVRERLTAVNNAAKTIGIINAVTSYQTADCGEFSSLCAAFLLEAGFTGRIETFGIHMGMHHFIVMDRDIKSDPKNAASWGPRAVICDAWSGHVYPASHFLNECLTLTNTVDFSRDEQLNVVAAFVPGYHTLVLRKDHTPGIPAPSISPFKKT